MAEKELKRIEYLLDLHDPEAAEFFLKQPVEKFLKAFLLSKGWGLKRTHDLEVLLNEALIYNPSLEPFRTVCQKITGFYLMERYPLVAEVGLTEDDIRDSLNKVKGLIQKLRVEVGGTID
ncbi:MAG: HEPN domain-containing protein [Deltaproteobacteria bacterium]|nr:HEPN domain-containing protein [Deltaproteobacteria bacterium]